MNIARTPAEENIWNKLLHIHLDKAMDESPLTPVSEVYAETLKDFFEWKWINLVDTEKPHFTIDEYYEKAKQFGPDLNAIPRTRFMKPQPSKKRLSAYNFYVRAMREKEREKGSNLNFKELSSMWSKLEPNERAIYDEMAANQDLK